MYGNKSVVGQNGVKKEIRFIRADIDDCAEAAEAFEIEALPSAIVILDQKIRSTHFGQNVAKIREEIEHWLTSEMPDFGSDTQSLSDMTSLNERQR